MPVNAGKSGEAPGRPVRRRALGRTIPNMMQTPSLPFGGDVCRVGEVSSLASMVGGLFNGTD
ncbi:MAG: hypothetical protein FJX44_05210 [Alphaproteobacteria bacterium]|nr:hypothetical protein [Alphaproteobacteria bacterium]